MSDEVELEEPAPTEYDSEHWPWTTPLDVPPDRAAAADAVFTQAPTRALVVEVKRRLPAVPRELMKEAKYRARTIDAIIDVASREMHRVGLMVHPERTDFDQSWFEVETKGQKVSKVQAVFGSVWYRVVGRADDGFVIEVKTGAHDYSDKATHQAMTIAYKIALSQLFAIPYGDDPDHANEPTSVEAKATAAQRRDINRDRERLSPELRDQLREWVKAEGFPETPKLLTRRQADAILGWIHDHAEPFHDSPADVAAAQRPAASAADDAAAEAAGAQTPGQPRPLPWHDEGVDTLIANASVAEFKTWVEAWFGNIDNLRVIGAHQHPQAMLTGLMQAEESARNRKTMIAWLGEYADNLPETETTVDDEPADDGVEETEDPEPDYEGTGY